jgi:hypothetical protein
MTAERRKQRQKKESSERQMRQISISYGDRDSMNVV